MFGAAFIGMCAGTCLTWGDASGQTRFDAKVSVLAIACILFPVGTALMLRGVHTRPLRERAKAKSRPGNAVVFGVPVVWPLLESEDSWQPVFFAASAAFLLAYMIAMSLVFLAVSPEEEVARRQGAEST